MLDVASEPRFTEHRVIIFQEIFPCHVTSILPEEKITSIRGMAEQARVDIVQFERYGARGGIEVLLRGFSYQNTVNPYSCACEE